MITRLSNLALKLYSWYVQNGHARDKDDQKHIDKFFQDNLPIGAFEQTGFYEQMYLYQSYCWLGFIRQDFLMYYRYTQKWVDLFHANPSMLQVETAHYVKGIHNLLNAHFDLRNYQQFAKTLKQFELFSETASNSLNFFRKPI